MSKQRSKLLTTIVYQSGCIELRDTEVVITSTMGGGDREEMERDAFLYAALANRYVPVRKAL